MIIKNKIEVSRFVKITTFFNTNNDIQLVIVYSLIDNQINNQTNNWLCFIGYYVNGVLKRAYNDYYGGYTNSYYYSKELIKKIYHDQDQDTIHYFLKDKQLSKVEFFIELAKLRVGE